MDSAEILRANKHGENLNKRVLCGKKLSAVFTFSSAAAPFPLLYQQIFPCLNALKPQRNVREISVFYMTKNILLACFFLPMEEQPFSTAVFWRERE